MGAALHTKPQLFQLWVTKHVSGFCATGKMMKKFRCQAHETCPCSKLPCVVGDTAHLLICLDVRIRTAWATKTFDLEEWVGDTAGPHIQEAIMFLIRRKEADLYEYQQWPGEIHQTYEDQRELEWHNLMKGRIATSWRVAIAQHLKQRQSRRSAVSWIEDLVSKLLEITHHLWITLNGVLY